MPYFASFYINAQNNNPICMNKFTIDIDETFKYYYRPLCLYVLHYVHDTDIAEDIVQDSFSILWEKLSISGAEIENVKAYLYTTALLSTVQGHGAKNYYQKRQPDHPGVGVYAAIYPFSAYGKAGVRPHCSAKWNTEKPHYRPRESLYPGTCFVGRAWTPGLVR